jgi:farnesyl-diphosphate farnesyltransferase
MSGSVEVWSGKSGKDENFPVGSLLIAPQLRPHMQAFYEFARNADDIADSPDLDGADKVRRLDVMEAVLLGHASAGSPSAAGLRASLAATGVTHQHACDLLVAFRRDAGKRRYASWAELLEYCRYSAMPVGRHVLDLHGESADTWEPSDALCAALQVLNHLQDGSKDLAALDRCYLPQDLLDRFGGAVEQLAGPAETPGLRATFNALLDECDALHATAAALAPRCRSRRLRLETAVILGLARRLAARLRAADPVAGRVKLQKIDVLGALFGAIRFLP